MPICKQFQQAARADLLCQIAKAGGLLKLAPRINLLLPSNCMPAVKTGFWQGRTVKPMHTSVSQHVVPTMTVTFCINHDGRNWHVLPVDMAPLLAVSMNNANQSILRLSAQLVPSSCLNPFILANQASWPIKLHHSSWPDSSSCNGWMSQSLVLSCLCSQDSSWHATHCADAAHQLDTCFIRYVQ